MSKDVDRVIRRSACLGAHPSNIEEELAESSFAFLSYEKIMRDRIFNVVQSTSDSNDKSSYQYENIDPRAK